MTDSGNPTFQMFHFKSKVVPEEPPRYIPALVTPQMYPPKGIPLKYPPRFSPKALQGPPQGPPSYKMPQ